MGGQNFSFAPKFPPVADFWLHIVYLCISGIGQAKCACNDVQGVLDITERRLD